jgi:NAD(P)-dependent dehydrogenase (short-subunit alcohol dehydrogenase family)
MTSVIIFGPTGQVGSVAARTAAELGAKVWLAMRDIKKSIPGLSEDEERSWDIQRIQADLQDPVTVSQAVKTSGAKRVFIYLVHGASDHMKGTIAVLKASGIEFVVFLSSFTIPANKNLRDIPASDILPHVHAQVEANLDDTFGSDNYVAVRPGCFITNSLSEKNGIVANKVKMYGGEFEQDNIVPSDIGRVVGNILVSGPRDGQKKVYLYGPEVLSLHDTIAKIGKTLGKDLSITALGSEEGYERYLSFGMPDAHAKYMVKILGTKGPDKGNGERFPNYKEGVNNVKLYTGKPSTSLEEWVKENKAIFAS